MQTQINRLSALTSRLVGMPSISPSNGESLIAGKIVNFFSRRGIQSSMIQISDGRSNSFAFLPGQGGSSKTLLLFGHIDTVGIADYGALRQFAFDPDKLKRALIRENTETRAVEDLKTGNYLCGRGAFDMKSGVAIEMSVIEHLKQNPVNGNIIFFGTPDEENGSAGMMEGLSFIREFASQKGLEIVGAINADYTTERFPGDGSRYLYIGTIGKILPSFLIFGDVTHAGEVYNGISPNMIAAELVRQIELNVSLCDNAHGEVTQPPVALKMMDLKPKYDVQTPLWAWVYFNMFTHSRSPEQAMAKVEEQAIIAAKIVEARFMGSCYSYAKRSRSGLPGREFNISVIPFSRLLQGMEIDESAAGDEADPRERSRLIVQDLWLRSGIRSELSGPAIISFLSPPYYPHGSIDIQEERTSVFVKAAISAARRNGLTIKHFYPYISDNSYLRIPADGANLGNLMPLWRRGYSIPLDDIAALNLPVVNIGPWGVDAHKRTERVFAPYSFGVVPKIMEDVIRRTFK